MRRASSHMSAPCYTLLGGYADSYRARAPLGCSADSLSGLPTHSSETHRYLYESQTWMDQSSITNCNGTGISILNGFTGPVEPNFFVGTNSVRSGKSNSRPNPNHPLIATPSAWVEHRGLHCSVQDRVQVRRRDACLLIWRRRNHAR